MGVALSGGPNVYAVFDASTRAAFVANLHTQLVAAGWSAAAITGGWKFTGTSPQGLIVDLSVTDPGSGTQVNLQFSSAGGTGIDRPLRVGAGFLYQVVANPCQLFISRPGLNGDVNGSVVCGGVPWVPSVTCEGSTVSEAASEAWWASSDAWDPFAFAATPRTTLLQYHANHDYGSNINGGKGEAVWNGSHCVADREVGMPEIVTVASTEDIDQNYVFHDAQSPTLWYPDQPFLYEPVIAWGTTKTDQPVIRGQIWDAVISSKGYPMDADQKTEPLLTVPTYDEFGWINYTHNYFWGSLWLIIGEPGIPAGGANQNYIY